MQKLYLALPTFLLVLSHRYMYRKYKTRQAYKELNQILTRAIHTRYNASHTARKSISERDVFLFCRMVLKARFHGRLFLLKVKNELENRRKEDRICYKKKQLISRLLRLLKPKKPPRIFGVAFINK